MKRPLLPRVLFCASTALPLFSATILVDPNPPVIARSITDIVNGADMTGLIVTASYNTPGTTPTIVTAVWAPNGPTSGAASVVLPSVGPILTVSVTGSASGALAWQYSSLFLSPLISLTLDGTAVGVYFDRAHSGLGTPGSGPGADISFGPLLPNDVENFVVVTYSGAVRLDGNAPQNDLYAQMTISFEGVGAPPFEGLEPQGFAFTQPVDRNVVSEPASALLVLAGLAALSAIGREASVCARKPNYVVELCRKPHHKGSESRVATPAVQAWVLRKTTERPDDASTPWTCRKMAAALGLSKSTVQRIWHQARIKPHRLDPYMASNDR